MERIHNKSIKKTRKAQIRTKNFSAKPLRNSLFSKQSVIVRLGSTTPLEKAYPKKVTFTDIIEINTVEAVENSRNKLNMKTCFSLLDLPQAKWWSSIQELKEERELSYPIVDSKNTYLLLVLIVGSTIKSNSSGLSGIPSLSLSLNVTCILLMFT